MNFTGMTTTREPKGTKRRGAGVGEAGQTDNGGGKVEGECDMGGGGVVELVQACKEWESKKSVQVAIEQHRMMNDGQNESVQVAIEQHGMMNDGQNEREQP